MPKKDITPKSKKSKLSSDRIDCMWGIICSLSSIDQQRNNISIFNIIDQLTLPKKILAEELKTKSIVQIGLEHELVILWRRAMPLHLCHNRLVVDVKISSIDPNGAIVGEVLNQIEFKPGNKIMRMRLQTMFLNITAEGDYVYKIEAIQPNETNFKALFSVPYLVQFL